jgi:hypothetical protein
MTIVCIGHAKTRTPKGAKIGGVDPVVLLCRAHGLPEPATETRFDPVRRWRADYLWRDARVILEVDGGIYRGGHDPGTATGGHSSIAGIVRDMDKANAAQLAGYLYLRTTPAHVARGDVVDLLRRALKGRAMPDYFLHVTPSDADVVLYPDDAPSIVGEKCQLHGRPAHCLHIPAALPAQAALLRVSADGYVPHEQRGRIVPQGSDHVPAVFHVDDVRLQRIDDAER